MRGTKRGVIASVDSATSPKYATVLIDNHIPGESGYSIPAGWGPFAAGGTSGFNYFYNNSSGTGGSWVLVDADRKMILALDQGISTTPATPYYQAITDHLHSGNLNPDGFTNPQPIDLSAGQSQNALPYMQHGSAIRGVINSSGQILSTVFSGAMVDPDGSIVNANGAHSDLTYTLATNQVFTVTLDILNGSPGTKTSGVILGDQTNGYGLVWDTTNKQYIVKYVAGVATTLSTTATATQDNTYHSFRLSISPGSPNTLEGSIGTNSFSITDSSLNLTSGSWYITVLTG